MRVIKVSNGLQVVFESGLDVSGDWDEGVRATLP